MPMLMHENLNEAQRQAVMHGEGPLLVLAGPGSGKTFTITQRILYLIESLGVSPEEILVITFTKEAAISMQRRFYEQSDQSYPVNFGTFHSVFYHILNQSNHSFKNQILREEQKKHLIYPIVKKYQYELYRAHSYIDGQRIYEDVSLLLSAISLFKNTGSMDAAVKELPPDWKTVFEAVYKEYEGIRKQRRLIDFDDMVYECARLLEKDETVRKYWQGRFAHILMDEFQDINPMQYRVIGLLAKKPCNLFAVGDDDQAIYGFRGSNPMCLKRFQKDYEAKRILLNMNYRSHEEIVKASALVIEENKERFQKKLTAAGAPYQTEGEGKGMHVCVRTFTEREEQYQYLCQIFSKLAEKSTYAVLFRTNSYMQGFAARLQRQGIPFSMKEKASSIYENQIAKDIMAYLRLASGETDRNLWLQVLNKPSRYISREALANRGDISLEDIKSYYLRSRTNGTTFLQTDKARSAILTLEKQLKYLQKATPFLGVQYIRKVIGYEKYIYELSRTQRGGKARLEEAIEFLDWLSADAKQYNTVKEWQRAQAEYSEMLHRKRGLAERREMENAPQEAGLQLMTIHASKGLEFDHVWIPDCNEKVFPHGSMPDKESCEEERRIFYVGMTRAKKSLELLGITGTQERPRLLSRFLNPLWKAYLSSPTISSNSH